MESPEEKRGRELVAKAEGALTKWTFFSSNSKFEEASEFYAKAANNFKIAKNWQAAAECFGNCAEMSIKTQNQYDAASNYVLAAEMMKRVDPGAAIGMYRSAISILGELGKFGTAAKHAESIGQMYEEDNNLKEAVVYYQQAADFFAGDNSSARAGKCIEKVSFLSASLGDYAKARQGFEKLGADSMSSNLLKFNAKKHFLHAGMCAMARNDLVATRNAINQYCDLDYTFRECAECKLLENLVAAADNMDPDSFADTLYSYDSVRKLDPWETSIFLVIKGHLGGKDAAAGGEEEDDLR